MTKKTISEPISPTAITIEPTAADQPAQPAEPRIFDFTGPVELMDDLTKNVYYRLRRIAVMAKDGEFIVNEGRGDASRLPDGKTFRHCCKIN